MKSERDCMEDEKRGPNGGRRPSSHVQASQTGVGRNHAVLKVRSQTHRPNLPRRTSL
jgi:hypothetical protein